MANWLIGGKGERPKPQVIWFAPTVVDTPITVDAASFDVDGQAIGLEWANKYDPATFDIDGQVITLTLGTPITVDSAAFDIDGQDITLTWTQNWTLPVDVASFDIDGQDIALNKSWSTIVDTASFDVDGQEITLNQSWSLAVDPAAFDIDGQDITLIWDMGGVDTPITVDSTAFSVVGSEIDLLWTRTQQTFSGGWVESEYEKRHAKLKDEIRRELEEEQEREELADRLEKVLVQEGTLTQAQADLIRLRGLASKYKSDDLPNRARRALAFAERAQSELAAKLALREIRRVEEEEEYAVLLLMALD